MMLRLCLMLSIITIVMFGICGVTAYSCFINYEYAVEQEKAIYGGKIVEAEYTKIYVRRSHMSGFVSSTINYVVCYEVTYKGQVYGGYNYKLYFSEKQRAEAESYIGQKVNIYVGEKGASIVVGATPNISGTVIPGIFCIVIMTAWILLVILIFVSIGYKRIKNRQTEEIEEVEEEVQNSPSE